MRKKLTTIIPAIDPALTMKREPDESYFQQCEKLRSLLVDSENRYLQLMDISPAAICIQQDERFIYANDAACNLLDAPSSDELLAHSFYDFFPIKYKKIANKALQQNKKNVSTIPSEVKIINLKGDILDVEMVVCPFLYQERPAAYFIMWNATERKRVALHLEIQYSIAWILAETTTLFEALERILKIICERLQWEFGVVWAIDKKTNRLRCTQVWQMPSLLGDMFQQMCLNLSFASGIGWPGQVWEERKAIWNNDIANSEKMLKKISEAQPRLTSEVAFPILYEDKVLGVIEFFSTKTIKSNPDALLLFESIGSQLGIFVKRKNLETKMLYLAEHDELTGLSNRSLLEQYLDAALVTAKRENQKLAVLCLDLDNFKYINDSMGHQTGDLLLKEISKRLYQCIRPQDMVSRMGGDEFIILLSNVKQKENILEIVGRLQSKLSNQSVLNEKNFFMTASIGISLYPDDGDTVQDLIKAADIAMYAAKEKGKNTYQFCTHEMTKKAENRGVLLNNLGHALKHNEFLLYYQPKLDIISQKIVGMEALLRWKRPDVILLPDSFISATEESDLIIPLTEWVLKTACWQSKDWQITGIPHNVMSINISVRNLNKRFLRVIDKVLKETNLSPDFIEIELTESALMYNVENNVQILKKLKNMGLKISIDDFGTGYSSLNYLKRFPIDTIKIDQSFVQNIATDPNDAAIVTAIIAMSHSLNFNVIAEGVETEAQLKFLQEHGCDQIQGFYYSRPLSAEMATQFLKKGLS